MKLYWICLGLVGITSATYGQGVVTNETMVVTPTVGTPIHVVIQDYKTAKNSSQAPAASPNSGPTQKRTTVPPPEIFIVDFAVNADNARLRTLLAKHEAFKQVVVDMNQVLKTGLKPYREITLTEATPSSVVLSGTTCTVTFNYKSISTRSL